MLKSHALRSGGTTCQNGVLKPAELPFISSLSLNTTVATPCCLRLLYRNVLEQFWSRYCGVIWNFLKKIILVNKKWLAIQMISLRLHQSKRVCFQKGKKQCLGKVWTTRMKALYFGLLTVNKRIFWSVSKASSEAISIELMSRAWSVRYSLLEE